MKVCFVGIGSIAKRHIQNLRDLCKEQKISVKIDALRRTVSREDMEVEIDHIYTSREELPKDYDVIFLTNPTEYHAYMLLALQNHTHHFFIEKPVASLSTLENLKDLKVRENAVYYVACPLRYTSVIQYLKRELNIEEVNAVRAISSSYLPEWRNGVDYRQTYSAKKALGGGVSIDLIHEWDYLTYLFGMPKKVKMFSGKISNLEIDSDDYAIYIAEYEKDMIGELHLDYFGRKSVRKIEIFTQQDTIVADLISGQIEYLKSGKKMELLEERNDYQKRELQYFLKTIHQKEKSHNDIAHAIKVLKLTQGVIF